MDLNNNDDNNSSNGIKGKFNERLFRIRKERLRFRKYGFITDEDEENRFIIFGRNIIKIMLVLPSFIYSHVVTRDKEYIDKSLKENNKSKKSIVVDNKMFKNFDNVVSKLNDEFNNVNINELSNKENNKDIRKLKVNKIKDIDMLLLKKKRVELVNCNNVNDNYNLDTEIDIRKKKLQKEIVDLIKKRLVKNINEFEILQSELYILNELGLENIYLKDCENDIKEIKKLLSKINILKQKYDYLKDNVDFQYMLEYDDNLLIDKILELKDICSIDDIKNTIDDYKILDEYKYLYLKIDKLQEDVIKFEDEKNKKAVELKKRDIDFNKLKDDMYNIDKEKERYDSFVKQQEEFLKKLEENISKIESFERINYKLNGFNKLLANSFKYLGLLFVNPLKGVIPGIATQTLITKNLVHNLYNNLSWEEERKMVYESIDYSETINNAIDNLDYISGLVDSTLEEIVLLKSKYKTDFAKYSDNISDYKDVVKKLNKIENAVLGNKIKIEIMKSKMKEKEIINRNKMKMVKKLNDNANSSNN